MASLFVHILLLASAMSASAQPGFGSKEGLDGVYEVTRILYPSRTCDYFSSYADDFTKTICSDTDLDARGHCNKTQECTGDSHCYIIWSNFSGVVRVRKSGCWLRNPECEEASECRAQKETDIKGVYFCCCSGDNCNRHFYLDPATDNEDPEQPGLAADDYFGWLLVLYILLPLCIVCALTVFAYRCYRKTVEDKLDGVSVESILYTL